MFEEWKQIKDYPNYYISNYGRIKNKNNLIMKPMICSNSYLCACLWKNNKQKKILIHRLVALSFLPKIKYFNEINHKDENKLNNNVNNLEWCNHKYNLNYGSVKEKIGKANKGRKVNEETLKKLSVNSKNRKWINNGIEEKLIKINDIHNYNNYKLGRL